MPFLDIYLVIDYSTSRLKDAPDVKEHNISNIYNTLGQNKGQAIFY